MIRRLTLSLLMLTAWQAQAAWQCNVQPQDDIIINENQVQVVGASGNLQIDKDGNVMRDGKALTLNARAQQQAVDYQAALRKDLPWIYQGAQTHLEKARSSLDNVLVQELGSDSNVRNRLTTLNGELKKQMERVLEKRSDGYAFHHQAIKQVEQDGQKLVNSAMGGVMQDSINEMGLKQATKSDNPLKALMGNLGGLQQAVQKEWKNQEKEFQGFGQDVCNRMTTLETQRKTLIGELPQG